MTSMKLFAAAALAGSAAEGPLAAQYYPPQQTYPQNYPQQTYPQQTYPEQYPQQYPQEQYPQNYPNQSNPYGNQPYAQPYDQGYGTTEGAIIAVVDGLIGNRYAGSDRQAIHSCSWAAVQRARSQYPYAQSYGGGPYGHPYGNAYGGYAGRGTRVSAITSVERRSRGVRVRGVLDTGFYGGRPHGYGYSVGGDVGFRCDVDYRGYVYDVRLDRIGRPY